MRKGHPVDVPVEVLNPYILNKGKKNLRSKSSEGSFWQQRVMCLHSFLNKSLDLAGMGLILFIIVDSDKDQISMIM